MKDLSSDAYAARWVIFLLHSGVICLGDLIGSSLYSDLSLRLRVIAIGYYKNNEASPTVFRYVSSLLETAKEQL